MDLSEIMEDNKGQTQPKNGRIVYGEKKRLTNQTI